MWVLTFGTKNEKGEWVMRTIETHTADRELAYEIAVENGHDPYKLLQWKWVEEEENGPK